MTPQTPPHVQIAMARAELKALQGQQSIAEYGIELLSNVAMELRGTSGDAEILRDAARELESGEILALPSEPWPTIPDRAAELRRIADRLQMIEAAGDNPNRVMMSALVALVSLRLSELQTAATANAERIAQLEGFLAKANSRLVVPNLQV